VERLISTACHPREREDPEGHALSRLAWAPLHPGFLFRQPHVVVHRIPAFAGMTNIEAFGTFYGLTGIPAT
jgi:hypothetical protein